MQPPTPNQSGQPSHTPHPFSVPVAPANPTAPTWQPTQTPTLPGSHNSQLKARLWQRYRGMSRNAQILIAVGASLVLLMCSCCSCGVFANALNSSNSTAASTATTGSSGQTAHLVSSVTATRPTPTATPKPTATALPTATPKPAPKPTCIPGAVNCNPWGYRFSGGKLIYNPPGSFCSYFNCIASFWNGSGYVTQCQDGTYSKSGGRTGSCSKHGGDKRILFAP